MTGPTIYAMAGIPAPASSPLEFALDAEVWFDALTCDPHAFFGRMPLFDGLRADGIGLCTLLRDRGLAEKRGLGYRVRPDCPHCQQRTIRARKREWARRIFHHFIYLWDRPDKYQELRNQVSTFFLEEYPEITEKRIPIVFNAHLRSREIRRLIVYEHRGDA